MDEFWLVFLEVWNFELLQVDSTTLSPGTIIIAIVVFAFGIVCSRLISKVLIGRTIARSKASDGTKAVYRTLINYFLYIIVLLTALQAAGVPLTALTIFGGALAISVAFGSQNILNNFISGLIIFAERPVKPGDLVEIEGLSGKVESIGARSVRISDFRGVSHFVPNSQFLESPVTN